MCVGDHKQTLQENRQTSQYARSFALRMRLISAIKTTVSLRSRTGRNRRLARRGPLEAEPDTGPQAVSAGGGSNSSQYPRGLRRYGYRQPDIQPFPEG